MAPGPNCSSSKLPPGRCTHPPRKKWKPRLRDTPDWRRTRLWCTESSALRPAAAVVPSTLGLARFFLTITLAGALSACAVRQDSVAQRVAALLPVDVLLLGEQHDAPEHQQLQLAVVTELGRRGQLAALALEMAGQGRSTQSLPADATAAQVQSALQWNDAAWAWQSYGPVVMAAVRFGVPVFGANLPREGMRSAMANVALDNHLGPAALQHHHDAIRSGHCDLLPESQIAPMARIQIARDAAMASTVMTARRPGKVVLLVAGSAHVRRSLGIPTHLPPGMSSRVLIAVAGTPDPAQAAGADLVWETTALPPKDYCTSLRQKLKP